MKCDNCFCEKDIKDLVEIKKDNKIIKLCLSCYKEYKLKDWKKIK